MHARRWRFQIVMVTVLILEDDVDCRELLGEVLATRAHSCVKAGTLAELAGRKSEALACDLALLDINLGPTQPSGVDACRWLLRHGFHGRIAFLTGHGDSHPLVLEAATFANAPVLAKPIKARRLLEFVQEVG